MNYFRKRHAKTKKAEYGSGQAQQPPPKAAQPGSDNALSAFSSGVTGALGSAGIRRAASNITTDHPDALQSMQNYRKAEKAVGEPNLKPRMKKSEVIELAKAILEQAKAEDLSKAMPASAPAGSGGGPKMPPMSVSIRSTTTEKPKKKKPLVAFATTLPVSPMSAARAMFKSDNLHEKVMQKREMAKAENPDAKADERLGEDVESLVERHVEENREAERKEGHKALIQEDLKKDFQPRFYKCDSMHKNEKATIHVSPTKYLAERGVSRAGEHLRDSKAYKEAHMPSSSRSHLLHAKDKHREVLAGLKAQPSPTLKAESDPSQKPVFVQKPIKDKEPVDSAAPVMKPAPKPPKGRN